MNSDTQRQQPTEQLTPAKELVTGVKTEKAGMMLKPRPSIKLA